MTPFDECTTAIMFCVFVNNIFCSIKIFSLQMLSMHNTMLNHLNKCQIKDVSEAASFYIVSHTDNNIVTYTLLKRKLLHCGYLVLDVLHAPVKQYISRVRRYYYFLRVVKTKIFPQQSREVLTFPPKSKLTCVTSAS